MSDRKFKVGDRVRLNVLSEQYDEDTKGIYKIKYYYDDEGEDDNCCNIEEDIKEVKARRFCIIDDELESIDDKPAKPAEPEKPNIEVGDVVIFKDQFGNHSEKCCVQFIYVDMDSTKEIATIREIIGDGLYHNKPSEELILIGKTTVCHKKTVEYEEWNVTRVGVGHYELNQKPKVTFIGVKNGLQFNAFLKESSKEKLKRDKLFKLWLKSVRDTEVFKYVSQLLILSKLGYDIEIIGDGQEEFSKLCKEMEGG